MAKKYNFSNIEKKWQKFWLENKTFKASEDSKKPKYYQLETFPYPSGAGLHVGHPKGYIAEDIHARYKRMKGYEVLYTMGWDAFGLPTENYAIQVGKSPKEVAEDNVKNFKRQVQMFGLSYDWDREINTSHPDYYQWTQWIFLELYKKGLAYRAKAKVNWCPKDQTVLANEQVVDGKCERCDSIIEQREMEQWFFKITDYADRLLEDLKGLDWPSSTVKRQEDWIGKSEGAELEFPILTPGEKEVRSYIMGVDDITDDLKSLGVEIREKTRGGDFKIIIPPDKVGKFEQLMTQKLQPGFWNEYIANEVVFIFKEKSGEIRRLVWNESNEVDLLNLCSAYAKTNFKSIRSMLEGNSWYRGHLSSYKIKVFTTRPDTLFGATYMVLAPEHPLIRNLESRTENSGEVKKYIEKASHKTELMRQEDAKEKTGVELKGIKAINPATKEEIPVWVADYVLMGYGTGAIMAVPSHDERDAEFAKKFNLPVRVVVEPETGKILLNEQFRSSIVAIVEDPESHTFLTLNWGPKLGGTLFIGGGREEGEDEVTTALREIQEETGYTNLEFIQKTEKMHHHYFAFSKNVARNIEVVGLHFKLTGGEKSNKNLQHDEKGNFEIEWLTQDEVLRKMEDENHLLSFRRLVRGEVYTGKGLLTASGKFGGLDSEKAKWEITKFVGGQKKIQYKIRDWSVSRQRYWGAPIPIIYCDACGIVPVPENDLPVLLPQLENYRPKGVPPLASSKDFISVKCPRCGGEAKRDPETLDTFVDSSWYYLRYTDAHNSKEPFDKKKAAHWMPVDLYVIGAEHTVLHLLYSRFITKFLHDTGHLKFKEPFLKLRHQGLILGEDGQKMSKSKGNVVNPDSVAREFGVDALRLYEMFMGPFENGAPWDTMGIMGVERFLNRVWNLLKNGDKKLEMRNEDEIPAVKKFIHKTIKKVSEDIENLKFNTAISALMILLNEIEKQNSSSLTSHLSFLKLLHPFAPHMAQELWSSFGNTTILDFERWPEFDPRLIQDETFTLVIQVNGKVRDSVEAPVDISESDAKELALGREKVKSFLGGKTPSKVIYISKKLVSIVL